jgi:hypothetical protein
MFELYNLVDPMEQGALNFEIDVQNGSSKILELLPQVLILCFLEKMIFRNYVKNCIVVF